MVRGNLGGFVCLFVFNKEAQHGDKGAEIYEGCLGAEKSMWDNLTKTVALRQIFC